MASEIVVPGAAYRQLSGKSTVLLAPQAINVHTMAGTLAGTESWFSGAGRAYSHLGTGGGGELRQWQDLRFRAASDLEGNWRCISIENEDMGRHFGSWSGSDVPRFTDAQADTLVVALSWLCHRFGLPKTAIGSSCVHERGVGWHRLGVSHSTGDPNAPGGPWRRPGCPRWSSSGGKVCPGDRRIHQLRTEIIPRISAPSTGGFLMGLSDKQQQDMYEWLQGVHLGRQVKEYARDWMAENLPTIVREVVREELDAERTARHVKAYARNYIKENVEPDLAAIKAAVTEDR